MRRGESGELSSHSVDTAKPGNAIEVVLVRIVQPVAKESSMVGKRQNSWAVVSMVRSRVKNGTILRLARVQGRDLRCMRFYRRCSSRGFALSAFVVLFRVPTQSKRTNRIGRSTRAQHGGL